MYILHKNPFNETKIVKNRYVFNKAFLKTQKIKAFSVYTNIYGSTSRKKLLNSTVFSPKECLDFYINNFIKALLKSLLQHKEYLLDKG